MSLLFVLGYQVLIIAFLLSFVVTVDIWALHNLFITILFTKAIAFLASRLDHLFRFGFLVLYILRLLLHHVDDVCGLRVCLSLFWNPRGASLTPFDLLLANLCLVLTLFIGGTFHLQLLNSRFGLRRGLLYHDDFFDYCLPLGFEAHIGDGTLLWLHLRVLGFRILEKGLLESLVLSSSCRRGSDRNSWLLFHLCYHLLLGDCFFIIILNRFAWQGLLLGSGDAFGLVGSSGPVDGRRLQVLWLLLVPLIGQLGLLFRLLGLIHLIFYSLRGLFNWGRGLLFFDFLFWDLVSTWSALLLLWRVLRDFRSVFIYL